MPRTQPSHYPAPSSLFPDEAEVAQLIIGPTRSPRWDGIAIILERDGLPKVDPLFGGRYWPAVLAYLDRRFGVTGSTQGGIVPSRPDGPEYWGPL